MTKHDAAGAGPGTTQAVQVGRGAGAAAGTTQVRPARETVADLPADPFARRSLPRGRGGYRPGGGYRLSGRPAVFVLASLIVALLASSAAPTPLYAIYQAKWHF